MKESHDESHRGAAETTFRSRSKAWIVRGRCLAERIVRDCKRCPLIHKVFQSQQMGDLPMERLLLEQKPWTGTAIDLFGPYTIKSLVKSRTTMKVWVSVFGCLNTGGLHVEICSSYSTDSFMQAFSSFCSLRGLPSAIYSDLGSQLQRAKLDVASSGDFQLDKVIEKIEMKGVSWRSCPQGSNWRNGLAEARVKGIKYALDLIMPAGAKNLNVIEFQTLLRQASNTMNDRPLAVKSSSSKNDGYILPITPNMLLLGRTSTSPPQNFILDEDSSRFTKRIKFIQQLEQTWWEIWYSQVWDTLFPRATWKERKDNLEIGDICLRGWSNQLGKGRYILCRVVAVFPDDNQLVRTVEIEYRPQDSREPTLPYKSKQLIRQKTSVQKLCLISKAADVKSL